MADVRKTVLVIAGVVAAVWLVFLFMMFVRTGDAMILMFGGAGGLGVLNVVLVLVALVHVLTRSDLNGVQQIAWALVVGLVNPGFAVGALVYFILGAERTRGVFRGLGGAPPAPTAPAEPADEPPRL